MQCPICKGKALGQISIDQYYCWNCFVEFKDEEHIYDVTEEGSLSLRVKSV